MDINSLDDTKLLMQYFRKHDTDKNHKLDGLELLKAIAMMEEDHNHDDDDDDNEGDHHAGGGAPPRIVDINAFVPIVDSILEQDDKVRTKHSLMLCLISFLSRTRMVTSTMLNLCQDRSST